MIWALMPVVQPDIKIKQSKINTLGVAICYLLIKHFYILIIPLFQYASVGIKNDINKKNKRKYV